MSGSMASSEREGFYIITAGSAIKFFSFLVLVLRWTERMKEGG